MTHIRPGYRFTVEPASLIAVRFPELDDRSVECHSQTTVPVVEFTGRPVAFDRLARDLTHCHGRAVYVYPQKGGARWVRTVDAQEIAATARALDDLAHDRRIRQAVKA